MNFLWKDKFCVFGEKYIKKSFEAYHKSISRGVIIAADKKYKLLDASWVAEYSGTMAYNDSLIPKEFVADDYQVSLIIVVYSAVDPGSYQYVRNWWNFSVVKHRNPTTPVILLGCNADQRKEIQNSTKQKQTISEKMGVQLARRIKAAKFLECSGYDITDLESINENLVRVSARNRMRPIHAVVIGTEASKKNEMIQHFVLSDRLNVLDESLNVEQYYYCSNFEYVFSSFIEIDGEEHDLLILDAKPTDHKLRTWKPSYYQDFFIPNYLLLDVIVIMFSAIDRRNFFSLEIHLEDAMCDIFGKPFDIQLPIILVGTETDFRNDPKISSNQGNDPVTYEMGEKLARKIKAVKYMVCSSFDGTDVEKVFEEAVWASLRRFEEERKTLIQKEKGFLKRFF